MEDLEGTEEGKHHDQNKNPNILIRQYKINMDCELPDPTTIIPSGCHTPDLLKSHTRLLTP